MHKISIQSLLTMVMSFVLFAIFVPMTLVVLKENAQIDLLKKEKIGTVIIPKLQNINILLAQHRGTANRFLNGNVELSKNLQKLETQIDSAFAEQIEQCESQVLLLPCNQLVHSHKKWQHLKVNYTSLNAQDSFLVHSELISDVFIFLTNVADASNLSLDDQLSTYYLMNNMVDKLPDLIERIGQLRGFGSGVIVSLHQMTTDEQINIARLIYGVRLSQQAVNMQTNKIFTLLPQFGMLQQIRLTNSNKAIDVFLATVEKQIFGHKSELTDQLFYIQATDVISQLVQLYAPIVETLNQELDKRITSLLLKRYGILTGILFLMFLLIGFLFYFKKRLAILNHAIVCFEQLSAENYQYPITIYYQDEIGQLLSALTLMQNKLADNVEQLKDSIARLTEAQRISKLGDWKWDISINEFHCSEEMHRIFGVEKETFVWNYDTFLSFVKSPDSETVVATFTHAKRVAGNYDMDYRIIDKQGNKKIIHQRIESYANEKGKIAYLIGTLQDITLQREMESRIRLAAQVFDHVGEAIVVTDENNQVILVNNIFSQITGYSAKEVVGKNPKFLSSDKQTSDFYQKMWHDITTKDIWKGEVWNQRKDGALYAEMLTITSIRNAEGEIINYIGIFFDITLQKRAAEQIEYLAHYDSLTKLMNRASLQASVELAIMEAQKFNHLLALLFIDLDGFKAINDSLGHDIGDEVLRRTAERLKKSVRERDIVARLGGDEFVVVLTHLTEVEYILPIAEKIVIALNQSVSKETITLSISPSIGISIYSEKCCDYETLLNKADKAMYKAKTHGKNNFQFATEDK